MQTPAFLPLVSCLGLLTLGCASDLKDVGEIDSDDAGGSTSGSDSGTSVGSASATTTSTTGMTSGSTTDITETSTTVDCVDEGVSICDPQRMVVDAQVTVDGGVPGQDLDNRGVVCLIAAYGGDGGSTFIDLDCTTETHTLELDLPAGFVASNPIGTTVQFDHMAALPFWIDEYVALRDVDGRLLLAAGNGSSAIPYSGVGPMVDPDDWFGGTGFGVSFAVEADVCAVENPCNFDPQLECVLEQRQAIALETLTGESGSVFDSTALTLGDYDARVAIAVQNHQPDEGVFCTDIPGTWYHYVIVRNN